MTASPQMLAAFEAWKFAEISMYYASPCPDEVMDHLVECSSDAFRALQATPPQSADDMLLKLYPIMLREFEPKKGEPPMRLSKSASYAYEKAFYERLNAEFGAVSAEIASAAAAPVKPHAREVAA